MRETVTLWRRKRMVLLVACVAVAYAGLLLPFKNIEIIPGLTTFRPANFLPVVAGLLFGPAGAWGAALGNVLGDVFGGTWNAVSPHGAVANFLGAYVSYRLWGSLGPLSAGSRPDLRSAGQLAEYAAVVVASSAAIAAVLGWGMVTTGTLPFATFAVVVFASNAAVALVFGPPVLYVLYPRVEARGWLAVQILHGDRADRDRGTDRRRTLAGLCLWLLVVCWFVGGSLYSVVVGDAPVYSTSATLIGTAEPVAVQRWAGWAGLLGVVAFGAVQGGEAPLERLRSPPETDSVPTPSAQQCLYAVSGALAALFAGGVAASGFDAALSTALIPVVVSVGSAVTVGGGTAWLTRRGYRPDELWRILMWTLGGLAAFTLLFGTWGFYLQLTFGAGGRQSLQTTAVSAQAGMIAGFVLGVYDIRAQQQNRQVAETREQLELLNRVVRHDIRNRMQVVRGRAELLDGADERSADALLAAADDVIDLTETARGVTEIGVHRDRDLGTVSIRTVVRNCIQTARARYDADISIEGPLPSVTVDAADTLGPLIDHLLHNAVVHNDAAHPRVEVAVEDGPATTTVAITDNGPGVPDAWKAAAEQTRRVDAPQADAVGLYLARAFVDRCDGSLTVRDGDPTGCVIEIVLPRRE